jgi:putative membrane protein
MQHRTAILRQAEIMPEVIRYHLCGVIVLSVLTVVGIPLLLITLPLTNYLLKRYYESLEIVLTRRDLKVRRGILNIEEKSIPLEKITDLAIYQGWIMRQFGLKGIRVETAGQSSQGALVSIVGVAAVDEFRDAVLNQRDRISDEEDDGKPPPSAPPTDNDTTALLTDIRDSLVRIEARLERGN